MNPSAAGFGFRASIGLSDFGLRVSDFTANACLICRLEPTPANAPAPDGLSRRSFLRNSALFASGLAALAASLAPLRHLNDFPNVEQFLQKYYKELTPEEMAKVLKRIEDEVEREYGLRPHVRDLKPMNGVEFVYALNLTRCIGCRKCVHACVGENNQSRDAGDSVHPRGAAAARVAGPGEGRAQLQPGDGAGEGLFLHAGAVPAVQEPALREGLPRPCHLAGDGRHHGD